MKKALALVLAGTTVVCSLAGCGSSAKTEATAAPAAETTAAQAAAETAAGAAGTESPAADITLWTYPIGSFKDADTVNGFIASFNEKYPDIHVNVEYLDYTSGDDQVTAAIEAGTTPDVIMEGPERLVSNWGAKGKMVDLADLWDDDASKDIAATSEAIVAACKSPDGIYYEYPLCMTTHCMAINYELFEKADALQYINEDRTWTTENFGKALKALKDSGVDTTGVVYCGGQGGDQGTRALAMNLYSAQFTDADHTKWTMNSDAGLKGLTQLVDWTKDGSLSYDAGAVASDELQLFANGTTAMTFCWNASNEANYASSVAFTPYAVAFPSDDGKPELCGGIWGFGIFDNGDAAKIDASKIFIDYLCDDETQGPVSVKSTGFFPVRASFGNAYAGTEDEERMAVYSTFMPYLSDYYNVTAGWAEQRTAWWNLLQQIFGGTDVKTATDEYVAACDAATAAAK
ncbi:MAG: extracellular solute-binding protein [Lachnospiraceae bacterium]|nr:extracellular solute-binding protein [Lachnospiraceae bacterium]